MQRITLLCAATLVSACGAMTHEYQLRGWRAPAANLTNSGPESRGSIVLSSMAIKPRYETSTDGHTFVFQQARQFFEAAFRGAFRDSRFAIELVSRPPREPRDFIIEPALELEASGWLKHRCTARLTLAIRDHAGRQIARERFEGSETFFAIAHAEQACRTALESSFQQSYTLLRKLEELPGRPS